MNIIDSLEQLCLAPAPSGYEKESAAVFKSLIEPYVDSIETDRVGNVIATLSCAGHGT
jgi:putative aminopeptidase FrvX